MSLRSYSVGAELVPDGVSFRLWAPDRRAVSVVLDEGSEHRLGPEGNGYFSGVVMAGADTRYRFRLDGEAKLVPDPASRSQPDGPHGPSAVVDPKLFQWSDVGWRGATLEGQIIYELHVGTFTPEGTWAAAAGKLPFLKDVGVTLIEMMPVNEFPGRFGWGYDGVGLFAPTHLYGAPDELRGFIDAAHKHGIGVILDVVYNHLGPDGNYLACFAKDYFTSRYTNEWGEAINFDGLNSYSVREFFIANAVYWIEEFHFDGLRLDATQSIHDASPEHIITAITRAVRAAARDRFVILIGESEPQDTSLIRHVDENGSGLDALWNDDLHHSAIVAMTGRNEAYYEDHFGTPQEFISAAKYGYLFQGQVYAHQRKRRGKAGLDLSPAAFVNFIQNHDQIANSGRGERFHKLTSPGRARAMTTLILLLPGTPMLFQGQEFWASTPFLYFADHDFVLADAVREGRQEFVTQFPSIADEAMLRRLPAPESNTTFEACRLNWQEAERGDQAVSLHRDLIRLRREDPVFGEQRKGGLDGAVLNREAFVLRFFGGDCGDRLLVVNFGVDLNRRSFPEPLLAPPGGCSWRLLWSSENPAYGGAGTPPIESDEGWRFPGHAAVVLSACPV